MNRAGSAIHLFFVLLSLLMHSLHDKTGTIHRNKSLERKDRFLDLKTLLMILCLYRIIIYLYYTIAKAIEIPTVSFKAPKDLIAGNQKSTDILSGCTVINHKELNRG